MLPGGGAAELAVANALVSTADEIEGISKWPYLAIATALEVIPRTLAQNCGSNVIRLLTELRTKHSEGESTWGVNGMTGEPADMRLGDLGTLLCQGTNIEDFHRECLSNFEN